MSKVTNKKIEKYYFEKFRQDYSLPEGKVIFGDKPDVVIEGLNSIGIEITNFYLKDGGSVESEQVQSILRKSAISKAQNLYLNDNGRNIEITFGFDQKNPIKVNNKGRLEEELADLVKRIEYLEGGEIPRDTYRSIPELSFVYLNPKEYRDAKWRDCQVYRGQKMSRERLLEIVQAKEGKVEKYEECDFYWLVIVIEFFDPAQDQEILIRDFNKIKSEKFEKIFVYRTAMRHVLEVK